MMELILKEKLEKSYQQEYSNLLSFAKSKMNRIEDAEDVIQDVFTKAFENLNSLEPVDNLIGWLYTVTRNRVIDWYRKKNNQTLSLDEKISFLELVENYHIPVKDNYSMELIYESIMDAVDELPDEQQAVFIMQAIEGMTFKEIAEIEDVSINTLLARKRYAVKFLRKRLSEMKKLI